MIILVMSTPVSQHRRQFRVHHILLFLLLGQTLEQHLLDIYSSSFRPANSFLSAIILHWTITFFVFEYDNEATVKHSHSLVLVFRTEPNGGPIFLVRLFICLLRKRTRTLGFVCYSSLIPFDFELRQQDYNVHSSQFCARIMFALLTLH